VTVGSGIQPDLLTLPTIGRKALAGLEVTLLTAGGDFHPALRTNAGKASISANRLNVIRAQGLMSASGCAPVETDRAGSEETVMACPLLHFRFHAEIGRRRRHQERHP